MIDYNAFILDREDSEWVQPDHPEDVYDYEVVACDLPDADVELPPYRDGDPF